LSDSPELLKPNPEVTDSELQIEIGNLRAENESLRQRFAESRDTIETLNRGTEALNEQLATANQAITERDDSIESLRQELTENTRYYAARLNEAGATIGTLKDKLEATQAKNQRLKNDLGNSQAEIVELRSQLEAERADRKQIEVELSSSNKILLRPPHFWRNQHPTRQLFSASSESNVKNPRCHLPTSRQFWRL
jgi:chromosome segregation ATPase